MICFRALLLSPENQMKFAKEKYIKIFLELLSYKVFDICLMSAICLANMSENFACHEKLVDHDVLNIMCLILKESKHVKLHREACRFLANVSWNPNLQNLLISKGVAEILITSLSSPDKETMANSVIALSNLSCSPSFHSSATNLYCLTTKLGT